MGGNIPSSIRRQVVRQWLNGESRDRIAKDNQIGTGTVSAIIKQCKQNHEDGNIGSDFEFDLVRELAVTLNRKGLAVSSVASSMRLQRKLEERGLNEEQIESFIEDVDVHCFRYGLKTVEFINTIRNVAALANNLEIPVNKIPEYITQKRKELDEVEERRTEALVEHGVTIHTLYEYERDRPLVESLADTRRQLEEMKIEVEYLDEDLISKEQEIHRLKSEQIIYVDQLELLNRQLHIPADRQELLDTFKELRNNLCKYPDVISTLRERRSSSLQMAKSNYQLLP